MAYVTGPTGSPECCMCGGPCALWGPNNTSHGQAESGAVWSTELGHMEARSPKGDTRGFSEHHSGDPPHQPPTKWGKGLRQHRPWGCMQQLTDNARCSVSMLRMCRESPLKIRVRENHTPTLGWPTPQALAMLKASEGAGQQKCMHQGRNARWTFERLLGDFSQD